MGLGSLLNKVKRLERADRQRAQASTSAPEDPWRPAVLLPLLASDAALWREWLALCESPGLDAAARLAARVNTLLARPPAAG
ncbi:MAG: hypothetical protein KF699_16665 [Phycisphaeraceae bacterium]|nr:hypothetical protein [Phycisphaeraceae bacterium]